MAEGIASQIIILSLTGNQTKLKFAQSFSKCSYVFVNKTQVWIKVVDWVETLNKLEEHWIAGSVIGLAMNALALERLRVVAPES